MAEKSTGQWVGAIVGAVVGFFVGDSVDGAMVGASLGGAVGGAIDPPKGPKLFGPRLSDLQQQTSTYGATIARDYGTVAQAGNVFWIEGNALKETAHTEGGGKGGGGPSTTTYKYSATFAVGFCRGPIAGIRRLWAGSKLIYDAGSDDLATVIASNQAAQGFTIHTGSEDQLPDDRIQAAEGIANTPAYRGLAYIVFKDFDLTDYGNSLLGCPIKAEIYSVSSPVGLTLIASTSIPANGGWPASIGAQAMRNDRYQMFGFIDPQFTGYPASATFSVYAAGLLSEPVISALNVASYGAYGTLLRNDSPVFAMVTKDVSSYWVNGTAAFDFSHGYQIGDRCWYEEAGTVLGISINANASGYDYLVRLSGGGASVKAFRTYVVGGSEVANIVVLGDRIYVISATTTYCFDVDTLAQISSTAHSLSGVDSSWCLSVGDDGRVYHGGLSVQYGIYQLNESLTGYSAHYDTGYTHFGVSVQDGVIYGASINPVTSDIELRAWRPTAFTEGPVPLADIVESECLLSGLLTSSDLDTSELSQVVRGYRVGTVGAIRSAIEPLQGAFPFDVIQSGYKIKFVPRGKPVSATIDISELGAIASRETSAMRITHSREMDAQLPRRVLLTYLDLAREYDVGEQDAARLNTDAINLRQIELPIVMTAAEAAGTVETLLYLYWLERHDVSFTLPPSYLALQPADVIVINGDNASYRLRLSTVQYLPDGRLECSAKFDAPSIYTPTAIGEDGVRTGRTLTLKGGSLAVLLDLPVMLDGMDSPGFVAAMTGYLDGWSGGTLIRSDDNGQTWATLRGFAAPGAVVGRAVGPLASGRTDLKDTANVLTVSLFSGALASVSEGQLLNGANHFAIGNDTRWEIVGVQTCVAQADGSWVLSDLLRGRFGTESAMAQHQAGDLVVLLDPARVAFVGSALNAIGLTRSYRAVSLGSTIDSAASASFTYRGANLECLAPVYLNGSISQATEDWTLSWVRRTRVGGEWRDLVDASLGEASEAYDLEIWDATYTTLKRSFAGLTTPAATYTAAQQISDFGAKQTTLYLKVYQLSANAGRGAPLTASLTRAIYLVYDPYFAYLVLGLHMDGADGSTTFTDIKGKTVTAVGNARIRTAQGKYGGASGYFDGAGDYLQLPASADFNFGTGNLAIRGWIRPDIVSGYQTIFGGANGEYWFGLFNGELEVSVPYSYSIASTSGLGLVANTWYYVELIRSGNSHIIKVNGVQRAIGTDNISISYASAPHIGRINYASNYMYFTGYMDDVQVYKGAAAAVSAVPTAAFPNQ